MATGRAPTLPEKTITGNPATDRFIEKLRAALKPVFDNPLLASKLFRFNETTSGLVLQYNNGGTTGWSTIATFASSGDLSTAISKSLLTAVGDVIYASAAATPARLPAGTAGQVLTVASGLPSWATAPAGAVGGGALWAKPATADARDEEFEGSGVPTGWTQGGGPVATVINPYNTFTVADQYRWSHNSLRQSWYMVQMANNASYNTTLSKAVTFNTNDFMWARMSANIRAGSNPTSDATVAFGVYHASNGRYLKIYIHEGQTGPRVRWEYDIGGGVTATNFPYTAPLGGVYYEYGGLHKIGSDYYAWVAGPTSRWQYLTSLNTAEAFDNVFMQWHNASGTAPGVVIAGADFFRFVNTDANLP